jgi:uncharacterized protein YndB with AHSA1/START domain
MTTPNNGSRESESNGPKVVVTGDAGRVWDAITTSGGITSWFMPTVVSQEGDTVTITTEVDEGVQDTGVVTVWSPHSLFSYQEDASPPSDSSPPRLAHEFHVAPALEGTCVVEVVSTGFDSDLRRRETENGWQLYLESLRLYLALAPEVRGSSVLAAGCPKTRETSSRPGPA